MSATTARQQGGCCRQVRRVWNSSHIDERRRVISRLIQKVVIHPSDITGMIKADRVMGESVFSPRTSRAGGSTDWPVPIRVFTPFAGCQHARFQRQPSSREFHPRTVV
jgi:hypothetical protein